MLGIKEFVLLSAMVFILFFSACEQEGPREKALEEQKQALIEEKEAIDERIEIIEEQKDIVGDQREVLEAQKELYKKQTELKLYELDNGIKKLRTEIAAANAGQAEKASLNKGMYELEKEREDIANRLGRIETVNSENWESYKLDTEAAIDNLRQSYSQLRSGLAE